MDELIKTFHIDWKLLIAQVVNFAIVVFALYKFAYKPLLKTMNERTGKIEKGLKDAELSQEQLAQAEEVKKKEILKAKKQAREIIEDATEQAGQNEEKIIANAKAQAAKVVEDAKKQIQAEKEKMLAEVKKEVGQLVVLATEKVLDRKVDGADEQSIDDAVRDL